jgi:CheY-like chemotaxis protein
MSTSTWMVVEDEPDLYDLVLAMYELIGINGLSFTTGEDAVAWIDDVDAGKFSGDHPDVALIDIRLPGVINGTMIAARMRKSPVLKDIRIVLMTAHRLSPKAEKETVRQAGANRLLYKPLPRIDVFKRIMMNIEK